MLYLKVCKIRILSCTSCIFPQILCSWAMCMPNVNFNGFTVDSAQAHWNDVRKICEDIKPSLLMVGHGCKCFFFTSPLVWIRWPRSIWKHQCSSNTHHNYKDTQNNGQFGYNKWCHLFTVSAAIEDSLLGFYECLGFWHFRYRHGVVMCCWWALVSYLLPFILV